MSTNSVQAVYNGSALWLKTQVTARQSGGYDVIEWSAQVRATKPLTWTPTLTLSGLGTSVSFDGLRELGVWQTVASGTQRVAVRYGDGSDRDTYELTLTAKAGTTTVAGCYVSEIVTRTPYDDPATPTSVAVSKVTGGFKVDWTADWSPVDTDRKHVEWAYIQRRVDGGDWVAVATVEDPSGTGSYTHTVAHGGEGVQYRIRGRVPRRGPSPDIPVDGAQYGGWKASAVWAGTPAAMAGVSVAVPTAPASASGPLGVPSWEPEWPAVASTAWRKVDGIELQRSVDGGDWTPLKKLAPTATKYTDKAIAPGHSYCYRARSYNANATTAWKYSDWLHTQPLAPTGVSVSVGGADGTEATVSWTPSWGTSASAENHASAIWIVKSTDGKKSWSRVATVSVTARSWSTTLALTAGAAYGVQALAMSNAVRSDITWADTVTALPNAPTGMKASRSGKSCTFTWSHSYSTDRTAPRYCDYVQVQKQVDGGSWTTVGTQEPSVRKTVLTVAETSYVRLRVRAHNARGWSSWVTSSYLFARPAAPSSVSSERVSDAKCTASWTWAGSTSASSPAGYAEGFEVQRQADSGEWAAIGTAKATAGTYADGSTAANHRYRYRVRSYASGLYSAWATGGWVYTTPAAPKSATAAPVDAYSVTVSWADASAYDTGYEVQRSTDNSTWETVASASTANVTSYTDSFTGTAWYRVRYLRGTLASGWAKTNKVTTITAPAAPTPTAPKSGSQQAVAAGTASASVTFKWKHNTVDGSPQTAAQVQVSTDGGTSWTTVATVSGDTASATATLAPQAAQLRWRVRTKGLHDSYGAWSAATAFALRQRPTASLTAPAADAVITSAPVRFEFDYGDNHGSYKKASLVISKVGDPDDRATFTKFTFTASTGTGAGSVPLSTWTPDDQSAYTATLTVTSTTGLTATATTSFTTKLKPPAPPALTLDVDDEACSVGVVVTAQGTVWTSDVEGVGDATAGIDYTAANPLRAFHAEGTPEGPCPSVSFAFTVDDVTSTVDVEPTTPLRALPDGTADTLDVTCDGTAWTAVHVRNVAEHELPDSEYGVVEVDGETDLRWEWGTTEDPHVFLLEALVSWLPIAPGATILMEGWTYVPWDMADGEGMFDGWTGSLSDSGDGSPVLIPFEEEDEVTWSADERCVTCKVDGFHAYLSFNDPDNDTLAGFLSDWGGATFTTRCVPVSETVTLTAPAVAAGDMQMSVAFEDALPLPWYARIRRTAAATAGIDVVRVVDGRDDVTVAEGLTSGASVTDWIPPLNTDVTYRAVAKTAYGARNSSEAVARIGEDRMVLNFGDGWSLHAALRWNPSEDTSWEHGAELVQVAGWDKPMGFTSAYRARRHTWSAEVHGYEAIRHLREVADSHAGEVMVWRDPFGTLSKVVATVAEHADGGAWKARFTVTAEEVH